MLPLFVNVCGDSFLFAAVGRLAVNRRVLVLSSFLITWRFAYRIQYTITILKVRARKRTYTPKRNIHSYTTNSSSCNATSKCCCLGLIKITRNISNDNQRMDICACLFVMVRADRFRASGVLRSIASLNLDRGKTFCLRYVILHICAHGVTVCDRERKRENEIVELTAISM